MADQTDDERQITWGLGSDLLRSVLPHIATPGLKGTLMNAPVLAPPAVGSQAPLAVTPLRMPGYVDSRDPMKFVPLLPDVSPAAFAAQQQTPRENFWSGYGAETRNLGRQAADLGGRLVSAIQGNTATTAADPDKDIQSGLFGTSVAADLGRMGADWINTLPATIPTGQFVAPLAAGIRGESLLPAMARAAIPGVARGAVRGALVPADDADDRIYHVLTRGARGAFVPVAQTLISD